MVTFFSAGLLKYHCDFLCTSRSPRKIILHVVLSIYLCEFLITVLNCFRAKPKFLLRVVFAVLRGPICKPACALY